MLCRIALILPLSLLLTACGGGGGGSPAGGTATQPAAHVPVALSVQWPASLTGGAVQASSIRLPSRVQSLTMEVQVLAPDFVGQRHTVAVTREGGTEVTRVDGEDQPPEVNGLDLQVPVGTPRRFYVTATAEVVDAAGAVQTLHFTGFLDLTVTGDGDGGVVVMHNGDGAADGVPQITQVVLIDGAPAALRVDSAAVDLNVSALFSDGFDAFEPPASWSSDAPGVAQVDDTGRLSPAGKGSATLTVTVGEVLLQLPVTVENTPPMDLTTQDQLPPAGTGGVAGIGDQTVAEDGTLLLDLVADDPDGDPLHFTAVSDAPQVAVATAGSQLTLTPAANFNGEAHITVTADDGDGGSASDTFTITVTPVNDAPVVEAVGPQTIAQGATLAPLSASDVDDDPLTFVVTGGALPPGFILAADGTFSGSAAFTAAGPFSATVTVSDGNGASDETTVAVTVLDQTAPVFDPLPPMTVEATGVTTAVALGPVTATDLVDGAVAASADQAGPFAVGTHTITWTATDAAGNWAKAKQQLLVQDTTPPVVMAPSPITVEATGTATDVALDPVAATDLVDGAVAASADQTGPFAVGTHTITWTATDAAGNTATAQQQVTVTDTTPPVVTVLFPMGGSVSKGAIVGNTTTVSVEATDLASDVLKVTVSGPGKPGVELSLTLKAATNRWRIEGLDVATLGSPLTVTSTDGVGNQVSVDIHVQVGAAVPTGSGTPDLLHSVDLAAEPDGRLVLPDPTISSVLRVDPATGVRSVVTDSADGQLNPFGNPIAITVRDDAGKEEIDLVAIDLATKGNAIIGVDPVSGARGIVADEQVPPSFGGWFDVALGTVGDLLVLDQSECSQVLSIDPVTGVQTSVASPNPPCFPVAVAEDARSILLVEDTIPAIYRMDAKGNAVVFSGSDFSTSGTVGAGPLLASPVDIAVARDGAIWVADPIVATAVFRIDPSSGDRSLISDATHGSGPLFKTLWAVTTDDAGRVYLLGADNSVTGIWQIEPVTGDRALISASLLPFR